MTLKSHWGLSIFHSVYIKRRRAFLIVRIEEKITRNLQKFWLNAGEEMSLL